MKNSEMQKRKTGKEQYYTPGWVAEKCTQSMMEIVGNLAHQKKWLEPAGGTGTFIECIKSRGIQDIVSYDIEPHHPLVQKTTDFLKEDISHLRGCLVLTNPPFGRLNQLSIPFFNKCAEVADYIGFLVPRSWRKWTITNRLSLNFQVVHDEVFHINFVTDDGKEIQGGGIDVVFQVWKRQPEKRKKVQIEDRGYLLRVEREKSDIGITTFGYACGKLIEPSDKKTGTYYYKLQRPWVMQALREIDFKPFMKNSMMIPSISIMEINYLLNEWADKNGHT